MEPVSKQTEWAGYYDHYRREADARGIGVPQLLDQWWADGRHSAEACVWPWIDDSSIVLEIACGAGRVSRFVAPRCARLVCTDVIDQALEETARTLAELDERTDHVTLQRIDGYGLDGLPDAGFDCVYSFTTFFHFDFELVLRYFAEIKRVLKPGGIAVLEFKQWRGLAEVEGLIGKIAEQGGIERYERERDKWRYVSLALLQPLCDYYGFEVLVEDLTYFTVRSLPA